MSTTTFSSEILNLQLVSRLILAYGGLVLIALGTIGNFINILVFTRVKALRQMPNSIFLLTFFTASLVQLWTTRFSRAVVNLTGVDLLALSPVYCQVRWLFGRITSNTVVTSICFSSIDRYLATSRNARYRQAFTIQRASLMIVVIVFIYSIPFIPDVFYYTGPSCTAPKEPYEYRQFINYFNTVVTSMLPFLVLLLFSTLTWRNIRTVRIVQRSRLELQVTRMMFAEVAMVCFTSLPNIVSNIYTLSTQSMKKSALRAAQDSLWSNVFVTINVLTYTSSFYLFFAVSSSYRQNVRTVLCCRKQHRIGIQEQATATAPVNRAGAPASRYWLDSVVINTAWVYYLLTISYVLNVVYRRVHYTIACPPRKNTVNCVLFVMLKALLSKIKFLNNREPNTEVILWIVTEQEHLRASHKRIQTKL